MQIDACIYLRKICSLYIKYIYIHKYTQYANILCEQKLLFWMRIYTINRLMALVKIKRLETLCFSHFGTLAFLNARKTDIFFWLCHFSLVHFSFSLVS